MDVVESSSEKNRDIFSVWIAEGNTMKFWKSVFCESDGTGSFARVMTLFLTIAVIVWNSYIVYSTKQTPTNLEAQGLFLMSLYGSNKFATALGNLRRPDGENKG